MLHPSSYPPSSASIVLGGMGKKQCISIRPLFPRYPQVSLWQGHLTCDLHATKPTGSLSLLPLLSAGFNSSFLSCGDVALPCFHRPLPDSSQWPSSVRVPTQQRHPSPLPFSLCISSLEMSSRPTTLNSPTLKLKEIPPALTLPCNPGLMPASWSAISLWIRQACHAATEVILIPSLNMFLSSFSSSQ